MESKYILELTSDTTVSFLYDTYLIDATSGSINLTLPDMTGIGEGFPCKFRRSDSSLLNTVTLIATGTTIEGSSSISILKGHDVEIFYDGSIWKLINNARSVKDSNPEWKKVVKSYTDFSTAALTNTIEIYVLPAGGLIQGVAIKSDTSFSGGLITLYSISVGIVGNLTKYASSFNVLQAVGDTTFQISNNFGMENWGSTTSIKATATSLTAFLSSATQGQVEIYLLVSTVKQ